MSKIKLTILQVGEENWATKENIPNNMEWLFIKPDQISDFVTTENNYLTSSKLLQKLPRKISALLLTEQTYGPELSSLSSFFEVYEVFYPKDKHATGITEEFLRSKMAQRYDSSSPDQLIRQFYKGLFIGQYGEKLQVSQIQIRNDFEGVVNYQGNNYLELEGQFGENYSFLLNFAYNIPFSSDFYNELFLEHIIEGDIDIRLVISLIVDGSVDDIAKEWYFEKEDLNQLISLESDISGSLAVKLFAKGKGIVKLGPLHRRNGRGGLGTFLLGGERHIDAIGHEFMTYFDPVDFKPPLTVYFSGFRSAEGFEGFWMMKSMKTLFMLICDPRLQGGAFYIGSKEYEQKIVDAIQEKLAFLNFSSDQLILSGLSMGTYGATYHGAKLNPHAIIIGKPIFNLGTVAQRERLERPDGFATSLDIQLLNQGDLTSSSSEKLNNYFWKSIEEGDFSNTTFALAYMKNDDYDATAFSDLLQYFRGKKHKILGRGWDGRHGDCSAEVGAWFTSQYRRMLSNDFGRKEE
ncbi:TPA: accessory Sec system protein Asp2 [Streptococcus agalactiae]